MSFIKDQLLARLQELKIDYSKYEHPAALTVEDQAKYVGDKVGALSKNLFLKDKKQRFYIVSALANTKVDLKVLSQRLGLGKGGLRMAPEEALGEILKVPLGCVTPFAVVNESARQVSLLLDQGFKSQNCCFFHPLSNDVSISLSACDLDKFLKSIGRVPSYVDLEANPSVGKDQPPDLASLVPSGSVILPDVSEQSVSVQSHKENSVHTNSKPTSVPAKTVKPSSNAEDGKIGQANSARTSADVGLFVEEILDKTSALVLSGVTDEAIKQHGEQLGTVLSNSIKKQLSAELKHLTTLFKNTAYTEGFYAGTRREQRHL